MASPGAGWSRSTVCVAAPMGWSASARLTARYPAYDAAAMLAAAVENDAPGCGVKTPTGCVVPGGEESVPAAVR